MSQASPTALHASVAHLLDSQTGNIPSKLPRRWRDPAQPEPWAKRLKQFAVLLRVKPTDVDEVRIAHFVGDALADALVSWMHQVGMRQAWPVFETALNQGLDAVTDAPPAVVEFFREIESIPSWHEHAALLRACEFGQRTSIVAGFIAFSGLLSGYGIAGMTKPLVATRGLDELAERRIAETTKFVKDVYFSGGMARFSEGFKSTIRVRVMHALVRHNLTAKDWDAASWGIPINQVDMAATLLGFSVTLLGGLRGFGFHIGMQQSRDFMLLWRYVGHLLGISPNLVPKTELEGFRLLPVLVGSQQGPDHDSRALAGSLLNIIYSRWPKTAFGQFMARREINFRASITRVMAGHRLADELQLPRSYLGIASVFAVIPVIATLDALRAIIPGMTKMATKFGSQYLQAHVDGLLRGHVPSFRTVARPEELRKTS